MNASPHRQHLASKPLSAVYAFSADPITHGHINIVERMAMCFSRCIVGIGRNPSKRYLLSLAERKHLAQVALAHLPNVEVMAFEGMVVDFAFEQGAKVIVKGVRSAADMSYEQTLHQVGVSQAMNIDTHLLFAEPSLAHVSSSVVKAMQLEHGFIQDYVPPVVKAALEAKLSGQLVIGLTGSIAAGKSTLAAALIDEAQALGVSVHNIDLDLLGHQILAGDGIGEPMHRELLQGLAARFEGVVSGSTVDRAVLAQAIFSDERDRCYLNELMAKPMAIVLRRAFSHKRGIVLLNGALLADNNLLGLCNYRCILCETDPDTQHGRLLARGLNAEQARRRLASQLNGREKAARINKAMAQHGFGHLWRYGDGKLTPRQLLASIIDDSEARSWVQTI